MTGSPLAPGLQLLLQDSGGVPDLLVPPQGVGIDVTFLPIVLCMLPWFTLTAMPSLCPLGFNAPFCALQVVGCGAESSQGLQAVQAALQQVGSEPTVVVMCTAKGSAAAGTPAAIAAEVQQVVDAHAVVAALHKKAAVVYASTPDAEALPAPRRQLLGADVGVCGQLCQVGAGGSQAAGSAYPPQTDGWRSLVMKHAYAGVTGA